MTTALAVESKGIPTSQVAKLFGVTVRTVARWVADGIVRPGGRGRLTFDLVSLLAIATIRDLAKRGFHFGQCGAVGNWFFSKSLPELQSEFAEGRRYLLSVGSLPPYPRLLNYSQVFENDGINLAAAFQAGVPVAVVDVERACQELRERLAEIECEAQP